MFKPLLILLLFGCALAACSKSDDVVFGPDPIGQISLTSEKFTSMPEKDRQLLFTYVTRQMHLAPKSVVGRRAADVLEDARTWEAGRDDEEKIQSAKTDLTTVSQALRLYRLDVGSFPSQQEGLAALVARPSATKAHANWKDGGYLVKLPTDPWGNAYQYKFDADTRTSAITSLASDEIAGGTGSAADIVLEVQ
jgi:general secretion pathway protein G